MWFESGEKAAAKQFLDVAFCSFNLCYDILRLKIFCKFVSETMLDWEARIAWEYYTVFSL